MVAAGRRVMVAAGLVVVAAGSGSLRGATSRNCTGDCQTATRPRSSGSGAAPGAPSQDSEVGLSPPWWSTHDWLVATIGAAPDVTVGSLEQAPDGSGFKVNVSSNDSVVAQGLALLLRKAVGRVSFRVAGPMANGSEYKSVLGHTLAASPYFSAAEFHQRGPWPRPVLTVVVLPSVIQIWNDNLASPWGLTTLTAEDAFGQLFTNRLPSGNGLFVSTSPKDILNQQPMLQTHRNNNAPASHNLSASAAVGFSAPWWITHKLLTATIGAAPNVTVGPLKTPSDGGAGYQVTVFCTDYGMARGLQLLLRKTVGRVNISVVGPLEDASEQSVVGPSRNASEHGSIHQALEGNPFYHKSMVHQRRFGLQTVLLIVMLPSVVQIQSDNLASPWGLTTSVADDAFSRFFNEELPSGEGIVVATLPKEPV